MDPIPFFIGAEHDQSDISQLPTHVRPPNGGQIYLTETQAGMTIRRLRLIALLGFLLLVAASVAVTFAALQRQRDDALVINMAGRQRMLIQKITLEVLGTQIGANPVYREALHDTAHAYFEATLNALISGGPAPYTDGEIVTLPSTQHPEILALLEVVLANWEEMHSAIHRADSAPEFCFLGGVGEVERLSPIRADGRGRAVV